MFERCLFLSICHKLIWTYRVERYDIITFCRKWTRVDCFTCLRVFFNNGIPFPMFSLAFYWHENSVECVGILSLKWNIIRERLLNYIPMEGSFLFVFVFIALSVSAWIQCINTVYSHETRITQSYWWFVNFTEDVCVFSSMWILNY